MIEQHVQGGTVNFNTGEHEMGTGFADEVKTAYSSPQTHFTHTGALQTTKTFDETYKLTISKRPDEESFDDDDEKKNYGQILATKKQVYEYIKADPSLLEQWNNTVSLHRSKYSKNAFVGIGNDQYPTQFFKKNGVWYKTVFQNVTQNVNPIVKTSTFENGDFQLSVIMWEYNIDQDVFEKKEGDRIGNNEELFTNAEFIKAFGKSTRQQQLLKTDNRLLLNEEKFYITETLLDAVELAQLKLDDAQKTAAIAQEGNFASRLLGSAAVAGAGAAASLLPAAAVGGTSAVPPAYSAAAAAAAGAAAGGTSAAAAAPFTLAGAVAGAPVAAAAAAAAAAALGLGVVGAVVSQFQQRSTNIAVTNAETELEAAQKAVETYRAANQVAENLIATLGSNRRSNELVNGLAQSRRHQTFANVAQQHRILYQKSSPNSANQNQFKRTLKSKSKRTPKSKCKKYQSRSRKTGHCRNKSKSRKSPCKSGKTRKGTGRCHKT